MPHDHAALRQKNEEQREQDIFMLDDTDSDIDNPTIVSLPSATKPRSFGTSTKKRIVTWLIRSALLACVIAGGYFAWANPTVRSYFVSEKGVQTKYLLSKTTRGLFRIIVVERGQLDSMKNVTMTNQVQGSTTIISIVPEGTAVKKGDIVCVLDSSKLIDKQTSQKLNISTAKANLNSALNNVKIQKVKNESDLAAANLKLDLAELDLKKYEEGEFLQQENESKGTVTVAQLSLTKAKESYEFTKRLAKKGYKTQIEVEADRIAVTEAQIKLDSAKEKLRLLQKYTHQRTIKELKEKARDAKSNIARLKLSGAASLAQFESAFESRQLSYKVELADMKRVEEQIALCTMRAPQKGEVVYVVQSSRRSTEAAIEEGAVVRERQAIIKLPDFTQMKVNAKIHESRISLVKEKMPVTIRINALPDKKFKGVVHSISPVPVAASWFRPDLKEYEVEIEIQGVGKGKEQLKPGLTAEVEILVEERKDVLTVPMQAVLGIGPGQYAYVLTEDGPQRREVKTGQTNNQVIEILDGINEEEEVILNPRSSFGKELQELETKQNELENTTESKPQKKGRKNKKRQRKRGLKNKKRLGQKKQLSRPGKQYSSRRPANPSAQKKRNPAATQKSSR